jgi:hypothetical protein
MLYSFILFHLSSIVIPYYPKKMCIKSRVSLGVILGELLQSSCVVQKLLRLVQICNTAYADL